MIFKTVELLNRDEEVLEAYQERFRYIMVDEYQDTNTSQFRLISKLAQKYGNLCVVGDDDQSIYKFRGANISNILNFENTFPGAKVIKLEQNYRSTQTILSAANEVIVHNIGRKSKKLWTENGKGDKIHFRIYEDAYKEAEGVVENICACVRDGWNYNDIAILYRTNAQSRLLEEKLIVRNVPYRIYGGINFYQRKEIKDILAYLKTIDNGMDGQAVKRIINVPRRGIGATTLERVQEFADANDMTFWDALCNAAEIPNIGRGLSKIESFVTLILGFQAKKQFLSIRELTETILEDTRYMEALAENETKEEVEARQENIDEFMNKIISYEEQTEGDFSEMQTDRENPQAAPTLSGFLEEVALIADIDNLDQDGNQLEVLLNCSEESVSVKEEGEVLFSRRFEQGVFSPEYKYLRVCYSAKNPGGAPVELKLFNNATGDGMVISGNIADTDEFVLTDTIEITTASLLTRLENGLHDTLSFCSKEDGGLYKIKGLYFFKTAEEAALIEMTTEETDRTVTANGVAISNYRIVISENAPERIVRAANRLNKRINELIGVQLSIVNDSVPATQYEILIGDTNRPESKSSIYVNMRQNSLAANSRSYRLPPSEWMSVSVLL